jgi:hypothetical protein
MDWIKKRTHVIDHVKFIRAGAIARDLYDWGLLWSGEHETDGEIPLEAVLASAWGAGGRANAKVASKLVQVGLWARTETGFLSLKWAEQGNMTAAQLAVERAAARERKARGSVKVRANGERTNAKVPTSTSLSTSQSRSEDGQKDEIASVDSGTDLEPTSVRLVASGPPPWFANAVDVVAMNTGVSLPVGEAWLRYDGHREGKGLARTQPDAQYWLSTVMVPEVREAARRAARDRERDAAFSRDRKFAKDGPEKPPAPTKAQSEAFAEELASRVRAARAAGGTQ